MNLRAATALAVLSLTALTGCSGAADATGGASTPPALTLSTEDTCREIEATLTKHDSDLKAADSDLRALVPKASTAVKQHLQLVLDGGDYRDISTLADICG